MADEEFLSLEDDDLDEEDLLDVAEETEEKLNAEQNNKLIYLLIIFLITAIVVLSAILFYLYSKKEDEPQQEVNATQIVEKITQKESQKKENIKVRQWLAKASKLYKEGKNEEALKIYEKIARYNQALSFFNIGVAKLKDGNFTQAIKAFDKASLDKSLRCESALNSAACAFNLKNKELFEKYLQTAKRYLPYKKDSPLFSYYETLLNYYQNAYIETIVSIKHPTSDYYRQGEFFIGSKIYASYESLQNAINMLEKADDSKNFFTLGLLYANIGEYEISADYLQKAIDIKDHTLKANIAMALVQNRLGNLKKSANILEEMEQKDTNSTEVYPIKVMLKQSLFDPLAAQERFKKELFLNKFYKFSLLFYYAPFKLSLYNEGFSNIKKGAKKIDIDKTSSALKYLNHSKNIAQADIEIAKAIELTLQSRLYDAHAVFKDAVKRYPWDSVLHYNLGLTYARMFKFKEAYKSFSKSQALDNTLFEASIFKSFCAYLINKDASIDNLDQIYALLSLEKDQEYKKRITALINIAKENLSMPDGYLQADKHPFDTVIDIIFAYDRAERDAYKEASEALKKLLPREIVANILYLDAHHEKKNIKEYAKEIQLILTNSRLDTKALYFGGTLPRELYLSMLNIAGISHMLLDKLQKNQNRYQNQIAFKQTMALTALYSKKPDLSYKLYNTLIDSCEQNDTHTLFLAAVSAIASGHHANAIALLELAKLAESSNLESRYALGLLYQEAKNFAGASIQYKKIGDGAFSSNFFTFYIKQP